MKIKHTILLAAATLIGLTFYVEAQTAVGYYTRYKEQAAASIPTPAAGFQHVFLSSSDHKAYRKDSSGTVTEIGGGGSTGNYTFSSNAMDLSGAAAMSIAPTTATGITLGQDTTLANTKKLTGTDYGFAIGDSTHRATTVNFRHLTSGNASAPSCAAGAALGAGSCSCTGTDTAMVCTFTAGVGATLGDMGTITYNQAFTVQPRCVASAYSPATAASGAGYTMAVNHASSSNTALVFGAGAVTASGATYGFVIHCIE